MANQQRKFGKYYLLDLMAQGGMAEIHRARLASADGAGRIIVIKRIQNTLGENQDFLQMFQSEIKVTMGFNHPNIVQLYDFGEENQQPYIAMEWVDGRNLRQLVNRCTELKEPFPVELAAYIAEQAAAGLQYAHNYRDKISGTPLNIVHRDISPQNILVSFEGNVKVIDFGIAKATTNSEATRAGVIKGKPSYLSPEQIAGEVLDGRSDLFALGAVLWESLTGKKLFGAESDLAVLKLIESASTHVKPPSIHNPAVPKELDEIVLRSLAKQRDKRYANCEDFSRALHKFIYSKYNDFNPGDLAYFAKDLFKKEVIEDRKKIQKLNAEIEVLLQLEPQDSESSSRSSEMNGNRSPSQPERRAEPSKIFELDPALNKSENSVILAKSPNHNPTHNSNRTNTGIKSPSSQSYASVGTSSISNSTYTHQRSSSAFQSNPGLRAQILGLGAAALMVFTVATVGRNYGIQIPIVSNLLGYSSPQQNNASRAEDELAQGSGSETGRTLSSRSIILKLQVSPGGGDPSIQLNGRTLPSGQFSNKVDLDSALELVVNRTGYKPFKSQFTIDSRQVAGLKEWEMSVELEPLHFGYLTLHTTPSANATFTMDNSNWTKKTPIDSEKLPVGNYQIRLENEILGMAKTIQVNIKEGNTITLDEHLDLK